MIPLARGRATAVREYWFEGASDTTDVGRGHACYQRWFAGGSALDAEITRTFAGDMEAARAGACSEWTAPDEVLALVLLLDQVPRHVYRGDRRSFASDAAALELARRCIVDGSDERLRLVERVFLYLPIQHSERLEDHDLALERYEHLARCARLGGLGIIRFLEAAVRAEHEHIELLRRFGRYPGRNAALGRPSTPAEADHMAGQPR